LSFSAGGWSVHRPGGGHKLATSQKKYGNPTWEQKLKNNRHAHPEYLALGFSP